MSSTPELMRAARFHAGGEVRVDVVPAPLCPPGGLLVQTLACGLCSGELMGWYMERKAQKGPHVLGHEVSGVVIESEDERFPVGTQVSPHHHSPCFRCEFCERGAYVHCAMWKGTRLDPGGMAEYFAVSAENLGDCPVTDGVDSVSATLVEPLACVAKQLRRLNYQNERAAVIGLGVMGLLHALVMPGCVAFEINPSRREWAKSLGVDAREPSTEERFEVVVVCPGSTQALDFGLEIADADSRVGLFAPLPPGEQEFDFEQAYMKDVMLVNSYSCGPDDTAVAYEWLRTGMVRGDQVVTEKISLDEIPAAYEQMKNGEILKPVVIFG